MNIKVHRGLDQIGGCITEISTETSRVFIDFGQNLPGNGEPTTPEEDEVLVTKIFAQNKKQHEGLYSTHMGMRITSDCLNTFLKMFPST